MNQTLWYLTPDMLLQGLVYLSAACALRLFLPDSSWKHSAALGLALGLGYWTKAAMFPVAIVLLAVLFLKPPADRWRRRHSVIALVCFCLVAAPLVLSLSHEKHRLTFGDSGKLNYAWFVAGIPIFSGWNGQPAENGTPAHASPQSQRSSLDSRIPRAGQRHATALVRSVVLVGGTARPPQRATPTGRIVPAIYTGAFDADGIPCAGRGAGAAMPVQLPRQESDSGRRHPELDPDRVARGGVLDVLAGVVQFPLRGAVPGADLSRRRGSPAATVPQRHQDPGRSSPRHSCSRWSAPYGSVPSCRRRSGPTPAGLSPAKRAGTTSDPARRWHRNWPDSASVPGTRSASSGTASTVTTPASPGCGLWPRSGKTRSRWPA